MNKVTQCFLNVHMSLAHQGLTAIAKSAGIKIEKLDRGNLIVFLNRRQDKIKVLAPSGVGGPIVMAYAVFDHRINLEAIQYLSLAFDGSKLNFDLALKTAVEMALVRKRSEFKKLSPLTAARLQGFAS